MNGPELLAVSESPDIMLAAILAESLSRAGFTVHDGGETGRILIDAADGGMLYVTVTPA